MLTANNVSYKSSLKNLSYTFEKGKLYALVGKNGSGKSTLIKLLTSMLEPTEGEIILDNKRLQEYPDRERARLISYMSQECNKSEITVKRLVMHSRYPYMDWRREYSKEDEELVDKAIATVGLTQLKNNHISEISGGERQKSYIAMKLAQDTEILILDEPTSSLDISASMDILNLLYSLRSNGKTIILALHDIPLALKYADDIILLENGKSVYKGSVEASIQEIEKTYGICISKIEKEKEFYYLITK